MRRLIVESLKKISPFFRQQMKDMLLVRRKSMSVEKGELKEAAVQKVLAIGSKFKRKKKAQAGPAAQKEGEKVAEAAHSEAKEAREAAGAGASEELVKAESANETDPKEGASE